MIKEVIRKFLCKLGFHSWVQFVYPNRSWEIKCKYCDSTDFKNDTQNNLRITDE